MRLASASAALFATASWSPSLELPTAACTQPAHRGTARSPSSSGGTASAIGPARGTGSPGHAEDRAAPLRKASSPPRSQGRRTHRARLPGRSFDGLPEFPRTRSRHQRALTDSPEARSPSHGDRHRHEHPPRRTAHPRMPPPPMPRASMTHRRVEPVDALLDRSARVGHLLWQRGLGVRGASLSHLKSARALDEPWPSNDRALRR
jgi:hypothetical protein